MPIEAQLNTAVNFLAIVKLANFCPFLPNLSTFGRFNQDDVMAGERGHDGLSFDTIRRKVITQFL